MYTTISKCRICKGNELIDVMSLGEQFLTGVFPKSKSEKITSGPIDLAKCASHDGCGLVQLKQSFDLDEMYGANYGYRSGLNSSMVNHLHLKVKNILKTSLTLTLPVEVEYEKLKEEHGLPEQIDLIAVNITLVGKTRRKRKVDILQLLNETEVIDLEDDIEKGEKDDD